MIDAGSYILVTFWGVEGGGSEKDVTPHPLPDKGLRLKNKWRGRRGSNPQPTARQAATLTN